MANLHAIREEIKEKDKVAHDRQKAFEQMMSFKKNKGSVNPTTDNVGSVETIG